ncbi:MAG: hypothetical protein N3C12_02015 [Candidatus Binatia bacterium]|nr:hypothetical protein [Candidatus Binatia bacterium]
MRWIRLWLLSGWVFACSVPWPSFAQECGWACAEGDFWRLHGRAQYQTRLEGVSTFPIDRYGTTLESNFFFLPVLRVGMTAETKERARRPYSLQLDYEHDLITGVEDGAPSDRLGAELPFGRKSHAELRRLFLRATVPSAFLVVGGGYTMSHWGLGLLANDGAHGWTKNNAYFGDPRSGDRVIRATIGTTPLTSANVVLRLAYDEVEGDDALLRRDDAQQYIGSVLVGSGLKHSAGLYVVYRTQDAKVRRGFDVVVYDIFARTARDLGFLGELTLAGEAAVIDGSTTLGPTVDFPKHDILQVGATVQARLDRQTHGLALDFLFASGDENFDDRDQNAFKVDPNYEFGLLLYRVVLAAQSGRTVVTAADPTLVGRPVPDLERIPTRGAPTNTIAIFPRAWWQVMEPLVLYGGPLFAWSDVDYADAFNTRLFGGEPHNALGGRPNRFYGTELDLGWRYVRNVRGFDFQLGAEGAVLFPGPAFRKLNGSTMGEVFLGRAMLEVRL